MFGIGDTIVYGTSGVCKIVEICPRTVDHKEIMYYVLKPVYDDHSTIYCPVDNHKVRFQKVLTRAELRALIQKIPGTPVEWEENDQQRRERFNAVLKHGGRGELIQLLRTLYAHREERLRAGKKAHTADERLMKEAENILHGEFAYVLGIQPEEVAPFIREELQKIDAAV